MDNSPKRPWWKRVLRGLFWFIAGVYLLACGGLYLAQEQLIFHPSSLPDSFEFWAGEEVYIPVEDEVDLHALWLRSPRSRGVIMYWHGNRGSNRRCLRQAENLAGLGYDIFMPDYRGYGKSDGHIQSQRQLYRDAEAAYQWLRQHYAAEQIVPLGYSLGTGIASWLASQQRVQQLVLVAPYESMVAMQRLIAPFVPSFLLKYSLRNDQHLQEYDGSVHIFHGTRDELIPFAQAENLQAIQPSQIELVPLRGVGHRGAIFSDRLRAELQEILR